MRAKLLFLLLLASLGAQTVLVAQSNAFLDGFLSQETVTYGPAAYLVLAGSGQMAESEPVESALAVLQAKGWALEGRGPGDAVTLGEYADLLMRSFDITGGLMYRIAPGPRYATREMAYRKLIQGKARPGASVSGERAARILGRVLDYQEKRS